MTKTVCDYCGEQGHGWQRHPQARADVAAWERSQNDEATDGAPQEREAGPLPGRFR